MDQGGGWGGVRASGCWCEEREGGGSRGYILIMRVS